LSNINCLKFLKKIVFIFLNCRLQSCGQRLLWHRETRGCSVMQPFRCYLFWCFGVCLLG